MRAGAFAAFSTVPPNIASRSFMRSWISGRVSNSSPNRSLKVRAPSSKKSFLSGRASADSEASASPPTNSKKNWKKLDLGVWAAGFGKRRSSQSAAL